ncbi:16042_t:CDS:2, partial [Gigaspora rosea]
MNLEIEEDSSYPLSPIIVYKEKKNNIIQRSFCYEIIKEGVYLNTSLSAYTSISKGRKYKIPDRYSIKTTIGRNKKTIYCSINYKNSYPIFYIHYGENFEYEISSTSSSSAANKWEKSESQNHYSKKDHISIKAIDYSVSDYNFHIDFGKEDLTKTKQNQLATVQALDKAKISREGYRQIAAVNPTIPREYAVSNERALLTKQMEDNIKITQINLNFLEVEEDSTEAEN